MAEKNILKPGSVLGGSLLVIGSCIGAGMLALPIALGLLGFFMSTFVMILCWAFMAFTGLLLVEINGWFYKQINIVSMTEKAFGRAGGILSWVLYLFLFYSLLVAYIAGSESIISSFFGQLPTGFVGVSFAIFLSIFVFFGTRYVDFLNRILIVGLFLSYFGLISFGLYKIKGTFLLHQNLKYFLLPLPILVVSFGFHNMIPSLTSYMKGDLKRMRLTILIGSFSVLIIYFLWNLFVLGIVPYEGKLGLLESYRTGREASFVLKNVESSTWIGNFCSSFAFFAIITSFLTQGLGLMHFLADGFKFQKVDKNPTIWLLTFLPPCIFFLLYPRIFFKALEFAGGFCAITLFGILPILMSWVGRYKKRITSSYHVKGGKLTLALALIFSFLILFSEIFHIIGGR